MSDMNAKTCVADLVNQACEAADGNGIYSIGAIAALQAMSPHWQAHVADGHRAENLVPDDIDGLIAQLIDVREDLAQRLNRRASLAREALRAQLMRCAQDIGDVLTDAPECAASVHAVRNLVYLSSRLSGAADAFCASGEMRLDGRTLVRAVPLRLDGRVYTEYLPTADQEQLKTEGQWALVLPNGGELALTQYFDEDGLPRFVVTDAGALAQLLGL